MDTYNKKDIEYIINSFVRIIITEIKNGLKVKIDGLGTFSTYFKNVYVNKTLDTGFSTTIPNVKCISFKPSKKLKE
jgi:nucleoid DNA-binding protein